MPWGKKGHPLATACISVNLFFSTPLPLIIGEKNEAGHVYEGKIEKT